MTEEARPAEQKKRRMLGFHQAFSNASSYIISHSSGDITSYSEHSDWFKYSSKEECSGRVLSSP